MSVVDVVYKVSNRTQTLAATIEEIAASSNDVIDVADSVKNVLNTLNKK